MHHSLVTLSRVRQVQQSAQAVCQNGQHGLDQLLRVLQLVDLAIDTFEYPFGNPGAFEYTPSLTQLSYGGSAV